MPISTAWDETSPVGSDDPRDGDLEFRNTKTALTEGLRAGGHKWDDPSGTDAQRGRHVCGEANSFDSGLGQAGEFAIYANDETTKVTRILDSTHATNAREVILGTGKTGGELFTLTCDTVDCNTLTGGARESTLNVPLITAATGRVAGVMFYNAGSEDITLKSVDLTAWTGPTGTDLDVDIHLAASGWSNPATAGSSSIVLSPPVISILAGNTRASAPVTSFNDATLSTGEAWFFEVDTLSGAADMVLTLLIERG